MQISVMFGFDMETDIGSWTPFYEGLVHGTPRLLELLAQKSVRSTFFFVVEGAEKHPEILRSVADAGHEVGCHSLYHETLGEEMFPIPGLRPVLPEECRHRIEVATDRLQQVYGRKTVSFRAPRLWGSTAMVNALEDLGYVADASYPMFFYEDRLSPYHPHREDWTREGDLNIVEIPNFADMSIASDDEFGRDRDQWPLFRTQGADALMGHIDNHLRWLGAKHDRVCLCFYMHPWEFWTMPQGLIHFGEGAVKPDPFLVKNCGAVALAQLGHLIDRLRERGAIFERAVDVAGRY